MRIEMEQIIIIQDITDPAINPAAAWLKGNHTKVMWTEPNKNGNFFYVNYDCSCEDKTFSYRVDSPDALEQFFVESDVPEIKKHIFENLLKEKH